jgi:hypothetical protein
MTDVYYVKEGRKYKPVSYYDSKVMDGFGVGTHIVMVYPGGSSRRYKIDPNHAAMIAAGRVAEDAISQAIVKASEMRPHRKPITEEQRQAWQRLSESFGDERYSVEIPSAREVAEAGVKAMQKEAETLMANPAVRKAYERFLFVAELTREQGHV